MQELRERARANLPTVLLTLLSIVQALALEILWTHVRENGPPVRIIQVIRAVVDSAFIDFRGNHAHLDRLRQSRDAVAVGTDDNGFGLPVRHRAIGIHPD